MRYVSVSPGQVELRETRSAELAPGLARVRVLACGVCGTDVHMFHGMVLPKGMDYPVRPGHEVAGVVTEVEPGTWRRRSTSSGPEPRVGDLVCLHPLDPCGHCAACLSGHEQRCRDVRTLGVQVAGGMAEEVVWPADRMVPAGTVPAGEAALLPDAVATAWHALQLAELLPGGVLVVFGAGGIGTHVLKLARLIDPTIRLGAVVRSEASAKRVGEMDVTVVQGLHGAAHRLRRELGDADAVVDFTGAAGAVPEAVRALARGGRLVVGSIVDEPIELGTTTTGIVVREIKVAGAYCSTIADLRRVVDLAGRGRINLAGSVTHRLPLERAGEGLRLIEEHPPGMVRLVLEPGG